ncbi:DUF2493 domain-containing protein [Micromonospora sp. WMMA1363]|uniref:DUF2493 domain-containing protein n=1 Tax=Micromonospora sp. WMMA1363 TaxID=3053985 RepID=UPI00259CE931|nr:DUF2493 domain-containing protein [Micromonospora sp. WMMA1363]MDM4721865.1 DUF2493 domain-containing protein [Micromonospora sp. WMMA1363]
MTTTRVLVTGSRDWTDTEVIADALTRVRDDLKTAGRDTTDAVLVSGACPTGADAIAERMADSLGWRVERHPADWTRGRRAGYVRNAAMIGRGADLCVAFIRARSRGATMTVQLAQAAGIPTVVYRDNSTG